MTDDRELKLEVLRLMAESNAARAERDAAVAERDALRHALQACAEAMESCVRVGASSHVLIDGTAFRAAKANAAAALAAYRSARQ